MFRLIPVGTATLALLSVAAVATAQPLVDRVLDRVQDALDNPHPPIPIADDAGNPLAEPVEAAPTQREPGYLGIIADDRQDGGRGVRLLEVVADSPAQQGGLEKGDLITSIGDMPVRSMEEMARVMSVFQPGEELKFVVLRGKTAKTVRVTLGPRPGPEARRFQNFGKQPETAAGADALPPPPSRPKLGVRTLPVTEQAMRQFQLPSRDGAIVVAITPGSAADRAGLKQGAVITGLNGLTVHNPDQLAELVAATPGDFDLTLMMDGKPGLLRIAFGEDATGRVVERPTALPAPPTAAAPDDSRLEAIERRLQDLEDRIQKLEEK